MTDAPELMDQIATEPALDELIARSPDHFTPERRRALVQRLRAERAAWENKRGQSAEAGLHVKPQLDPAE